jgi:hypothetical protein
LHHAHPAPAATKRRLDDHRKATVVAKGLGLLERRHRRLGARDDGHVKLTRKGASLGLVAKALDHLGRRSHERDARLLAQFDKLGVLRKETIPRVYSVHAVGSGDLDDLLGGEVGPDRRFIAAHAERLVGLVSVHAPKVLLGVDCNRLYAQLVGSTKNSDSNLAPVGGHDLSHWPPARLDRRRRRQRRESPCRRLHPGGGAEPSGAV